MIQTLLKTLCRLHDGRGRLWYWGDMLLDYLSPFQWDCSRFQSARRTVSAPWIKPHAHTLRQRCMNMGREKMMEGDVDCSNWWGTGESIESWEMNRELWIMILILLSAVFNFDALRDEWRHLLWNCGGFSHKSWIFLLFFNIPIFGSCYLSICYF